MPEPIIHYLESTDSTMLEARRMVEAADAGRTPPVLSGTVVRAAYQTAGRGRVAERKWESRAGESLLFTVIFTKKDLSSRMFGRAFTLLPLLCGLAVAEGIDNYLEKNGSSDGSDLRIKWPNDVLSSGRKICGILCEASGDRVYAGIGINLNQRSFDSGLRRPACSVAMLSGTRSEGEDLLKSVLFSLDEVLGNDEWQSMIESRLYLCGDEVTMKAGLAEEISGQLVLIKGILSGIDSSGALLLDTSEGRIPVINGELQV